MNFFRKALGGIGDVAKWASPFAALIPGVGIPLAAGIGAAGGALGGLNDRDADGGTKAYTLGSALKGGAQWGAIGGAGALGIDKLSGGVNGLAGLKQTWNGGPVRVAQKIDPITGMVTQAGGVVDKPGVWDFLKGNPELAMAVLGAGAGAMGDAKNDATREQATKMAMARMAETDPLRKQGLAALGGDLATKRNLGSVFADQGNPYARAI